MKHLNAHYIAWIIVGCVFAEAAFLIAYMVLTILASAHHYSLTELLSPDNPFYQLPGHFYIIGLVFLIAIVIGEWKHIRTMHYYIFAGLVAALCYFASVFHGTVEINMVDFIFNLIASAFSGFVYWVVAPRRFQKLAS